MGGAVVPWLVRSPPVRALRVRGLAENIVNCVFVHDTVLSHCLSPVTCMGTGEIIDRKLLLRANFAMD